MRGNTNKNVIVYHTFLFNICRLNVVVSAWKNATSIPLPAKFKPIALPLSQLSPAAGEGSVSTTAIECAKIYRDREYINLLYKRVLEIMVPTTPDLSTKDESLNY